jgi:LysM repeat protein
MKMKKFVLLFLIMLTLSFNAQEKKYVSYTVKYGETIKSIAKKYNISTKDLLRLNPGVSRKPSANTVIVVPNLNYGNAIINQNNNNSTIYTVQEKETLFGISKKFNITINELLEANPELKYGLKFGMQLRIPIVADNEDDTANFVIHEVVKGDTLFNLTQRYKVSEANLMELNPDLKEGLKLGMKLKIKPLEVEDTTTENDIVDEDYDSNYFVENLNTDKEISIILMLPYQINKIPDTLLVEGFERTNSLLNYTTDLHLGALMAIDSLRSKGLKINVDFYDTENSLSKLQYLVNTVNLNSVDVIVGPLYFDNALWISNRVNVPVVTPFYSRKQESASHKNLIKIAPDNDVLIDNLLLHLEKTYNGENIVVVNDGKSDSQPVLWKIVNKLKSFDSIKDIAVVKPLEGSNLKGEQVTLKLKNGGNNWVILASNNTEITFTTVNSLKTIDQEQLSVSLFAIEKGKNFDKIENANLGQLQFTYPTTEFLDTSNAALNNFYQKYKEKNYAYPSSYAIKGFDVTYDALVRIATEGNLEAGLLVGKSKRLASQFQFERKLFSDFENKGVFIVRYTQDLVPEILENIEE